MENAKLKPNVIQQQMASYAQLKKIDEKSLRKLTEGKGPSDKCLCALLAPPENEKRGIRASIKKAFAALSPSRKRSSKGVERSGTSGKGNRNVIFGQNSIDIPLTFTKGGKGIYTTKEAVKRTTKCGKCGCDDEKFVLKHSFANIRITAPDISSLCPCDSSCLPEKAKRQNNIRVTVENFKILDPDSVDSEFSLYEDDTRQTRSDPGVQQGWRPPETMVHEDDTSEYELDFSSDED